MTKLSSILGLAVSALFLALAHADVDAGGTEAEVSLISLQEDQQQQLLEEKELVLADTATDTANNLTDLTDEDESEDGGAELGLSCRDSRTFRFPSFPNSRDARSCEWLSRRNRQTRERICGERHNGSRVNTQCRVTCNNCPSLNPTCRDSSTFCVPFASIGGAGGCNNCAWIRRQNSATRRDWCGRRDGRNQLARNHCRLACDNCQRPTPSPTPSPRPSRCRDSTTFRFQENGIRRDCAWLSSRPNKQRVERICGERRNGRMVNRECRVTCNNCPSSNPRPPQTCRDSRSFLFPSNGRPRDCVWLSNRSNSRRREICRESHNGSRVNRKCRVTCNNCPSSNPTPPQTCRDSTTFRFQENGVRRDCDWLSRRPYKQRVERICGERRNGRLVNRECRVTCNNCRRFDTGMVNIVEE